MSRPAVIIANRFMMRAVVAALALSLVRCEDEALVHPPRPPPIALPELSGSPGGAPATSASRPTGPKGEATFQNKPTAASAPGGTAPKSDIPGPSRSTLALFMHQQIEPRANLAVAKHRLDPQLEGLLNQLRTMVPDDPQFAITSPSKSWAGIVDNAIKSGRYVNACRQCHALWKRPYHKKYHDNKVEYYLP